jgi:hypothetical protein
VTAGLITCWVASAPAIGFGSVLLLALMWFGIGAIWFVRLCVANSLALVRLMRGQRPAIRRWWSFAVDPAIVGVVGLLLYVDAPLEGRFALGRGGLEHDAKAVLAGTQRPSSIHRSGLYHLDHVERSGSTVLFYTDVWNGFAYAPNGGPSSVRGREYEPHFHRLDGPWYRFDTPGVD